MCNSVTGVLKRQRELIFSTKLCRNMPFSHNCHLCIPMSFQMSRSVSWSGVVKHAITALPQVPGAGRKSLRPSTSFLTNLSSPPMTISGRPISRQKMAWRENESCLMNLRALSPALLLFLLLSTQVLVRLTVVGDGGSELLVKLVQSETSSTLSSRRGAHGGELRPTSTKAILGAIFTWRSNTGFSFFGFISTDSSAVQKKICHM